MQPLGLPIHHMSYPWGSVCSLQYFFPLWLRICFLKAIELKPDTHYSLYEGNKRNAQLCGFSARVVSVLNRHSVVYQDVNVLENPEIRVRLSEHSNWPTIPQLFVKGELIGGCDIVMEMESKGELGGVLQTAGT